MYNIWYNVAFARTRSIFILKPCSLVATACTNITCFKKQKTKLRIFAEPWLPPKKLALMGALFFLVCQLCKQNNSKWERKITQRNTTAHKLSHTSASKLFTCETWLFWRHYPHWLDHVDLCTPLFYHKSSLF